PGVTAIAVTGASDSAALRAGAVWNLLLPPRENQAEIASALRDGARLGDASYEVADPLSSVVRVKAASGGQAGSAVDLTLNAGLRASLEMLEKHVRTLPPGEQREVWVGLDALFAGVMTSANEVEDEQGAVSSMFVSAALSRAWTMQRLEELGDVAKDLSPA